MEQRTLNFLNTAVKQTLSVALAVIVLSTGSAVAFTSYEGNGMTARIHHAADLADFISDEHGAKVLNHTALSGLELLRDENDPRLPRQGGESFQPLDASAVLAALNDIENLGGQVTVDILLLPSPPAEILGSYATRNVIVLSPGFGPTDPATVAWLVTHELGHVLTWAFFDRHPDAWDRYRFLRDLDPVVNGPTAAHADREREILAEDIRYLFGGERANRCNCIENSTLALPDEVDGLETFLRATLAGSPVSSMVLESAAWPNPCNPQTTIELRLPPSKTADRDPGTARLEILDLRGRRVRVVQGGDLENNRLTIRWNGMGEDGARVSTGRYFYRIGWDDLTGRGAVTVVR